MAREPITVVEIDLDYCGNTFATLPCTAALSALVPQKCFNTYANCAATAVFAKTVKTLRFAEARPNLPKGAAVYYPALLTVSSFSATVNIAGADERMSALGRRATVTITLADFPYHDRDTDKYQAERVSGAAQFSAVGYDPAARGSFFAKLKARWPYYNGRPLRVVQGELAGGAIINAISRAYVITGMFGPDDRGEVRIEAQDILAFAADEKAVAPKANIGTLAAAITTASASLTLAPVGVGATYPAAGRAIIGTEIVDYTRAGDVLTLVARAAASTALASHAAGDAFQTVLWFNGMRVDDAMEILLRDYAGIATTWIPKAVWAAEVTRWAGSVLLQTHITAPTGVAKLLGELAVLGFSIWPDPVAQTIGLKVNRPPDGETVFALSDRDNLKAIAIDDRAADRLTEVYFYSVQIDPTKGAADPANYRRMMATYDLDAKGANAYGDTKIRRVFCRWFNGGADSDIAIISRRLLNRFRYAPVRVKMLIDAKDAAIDLTAVLSVSSASITDATGAVLPAQMQVISRSEPKPGHEVEIVAQAYQFSGRYGYATQNACPVYASASKAQKARGMFAVGSTLTFGDGTGPYKAI